MTGCYDVSGRDCSIMPAPNRAPGGPGRRHGAILLVARAHPDGRRARRDNPSPMTLVIGLCPGGRCRLFSGATISGTVACFHPGCLCTAVWPLPSWARITMICSSVLVLFEKRFNVSGHVTSSPPLCKWRMKEYPQAVFSCTHNTEGAIAYFTVTKSCVPFVPLS